MILLGLYLAAQSADATPDSFLLVEVDNGHSETCSFSPTHVCPASVSGDGGDMELDVYQRVSRIAIAVRIPREVVGLEIPLLPDQSISLQFDKIAVRSPHGDVIERFAETTHSSPHAQYFEARSSSQNLSMTYYGPEWYYPSAPTIRHRHSALAYSNDTLTHDQIGFANDLGGDDTDSAIIDSLHPQSCAVIAPAACDEMYLTAAAQAKASAPNIRYGLEFYEASVATNPELLQASQDSQNGSPILTASQLGQATEDTHGRSKRNTATLPHDAKRSLHAASDTRVFADAGAGSAAPRAESSALPPPDSDPLPPAALLAASASAAALGVLAYVLYTRFWRPKDVLQSEARRDLLALVADEPGLSPSALAKRAKVARNTVVHHLHVLERAQLVRVASEGRELFVFPVATGPAPSGAGPSLRAARHPVSREVLAILQAHPEGLTRSDLRARMPVVPQRTLNYNVAKLVKAGLVRSDAAHGLADVLTLASVSVDAERPTAAPCPQRPGSTRGSAT